MSSKDGLTSDQRHWIEVQKSAANLWREEQDPESAVRELSDFLSSDPSSDLLSEGLAFRATIYQEMQRFEEANTDFLRALEHAPDEGHVRSELQESLALVSEHLGDEAGAREWFKKALESAIEDLRTPGLGGLIGRFLKSRVARPLSRSERSLAEAGILRFWKALGIDGDPDLDDLEASVEQLITVERHLPENKDSENSSEALQHSEAQELDLVLRKIAAALDLAAQLASKSFTQDDSDHLGSEIGRIRGEIYHRVHKGLWETFPALVLNRPADISEQGEGGTVADLLASVARDLGAAAQVFDSKRSELEQLRDMVNSLCASRGFL